MADEKKKLDFSKFASRKKKEPTTKAKTVARKVYKEVEEAPKEAVSSPSIKSASQPKSKKTAPKKVGRKSWKEEGVTYTRIAFDTPVGTKQKVKQLLAGKFYSKYISQDEMINVALEAFIKKHL